MDHTIVHFEIPADDPERAIAFYEGLFGWKIDKMPGGWEYWGVRTVATTGENGMPKGPGVNGGLMRRMHPAQKPTSYFGVEDIDAYVEKIEQAGGKIVVPKMPVPGHGWLVQFEDTEGNVFALWQADHAAQTSEVCEMASVG